jgi:hypothetical protein
MGTLGRAMRDDLMDLLGRHEVAAVAFVSGLPPASARFAAWGAGGLRRRVGWVGGGWFRGVAGVLVEAGFEVGDARQQSYHHRAHSGWRGGPVFLGNLG